MIDNETDNLRQVVINICNYEYYKISDAPMICSMKLAKLQCDTH